LLSSNGDSMKYRSKTRFVLEGVEGVLVALAVLATWPVSKRWLQDWGSTAAERRRAWPGDELVSPEHTTYTRAIAVVAPCGAVWPWLIQFGFGRAGFYSYELLERMAGIPVRNVESIVPDLQELSAGDEILLHPRVPGITVAAMEDGRHVCFGVVEGLDHSDEESNPARSWSMYVEPADPDTSRLLLRSCIEPLGEPTVWRRLGNLVEEPIDFIMEQRMLRTIKRLAEYYLDGPAGQREVHLTSAEDRSCQASQA
jgi:hypothetical protein